MSQEKISGVEAILRSLIAENVDTIFGYPGGQAIPIYDGLYNYKDKLNHYLVRHEQGASHAAQGYARATGKVGVCLTTSGPGATNIITGITDAMMDSTPIVCITGQVPLALLGSDAFQEADIISMTMPVTKWSYQVTRAAEIPEAIAKAFYIARTGRPGPVLIDVTKNAQLEMCEYHYEPCLDIRSYTVKPPVDTKLIDEAAKLINAAKQPFIVFGQGVKLSAAEEALMAFAEKANIPMASTLMGLSGVSTSHPLYMGMLGMHGNYGPNAMTQECDLLIGVGMRFSDRVTGDLKTYAKNAKVIHIDIDKAEINKNVKTTIGIHADCKDALEALTEKVTSIERNSWFEKFKEKDVYEFDNVIKNDLTPKGDALTMGEVIRDIANYTKGEAIVITDVGQHQMYAARYSLFANSRSFITSGGLGTMGFGLPAAIGAKIGMPDKQVILFVGDGGIQMTIQEFGVIMQYGVGVKVVILNNEFLGMVRQWQQLFFDKRYSHTEMTNPDFVAVAKAYNIASERVEKREDLAGAIDRMLKNDDAFVLEVAIEKEANVFPMIPAGASVSNLIFTEVD